MEAKSWALFHFSSAIYFRYFQCISISSYNPNQSNANFNIEKKRLAAPASSHRKPLNALRGWEQNLGTGATGDLPSKLGHTSIATMLSTISTVSKIMLMYVQQAESPKN